MSKPNFQSDKKKVDLPNLSCALNSRVQPHIFLGIEYC